MHLTCLLTDEKARPRLAASPGLGVFSSHWWQSSLELMRGLVASNLRPLSHWFALLTRRDKEEQRRMRAVVTGCDCHWGFSPLLSPLSMAADDLLTSAAVCFVRAGTQEGNTGSCLSSSAQELCGLGEAE